MHAPDGAAVYDRRVLHFHERRRGVVVHGDLMLSLVEQVRVPAELKHSRV